MDLIQFVNSLTSEAFSELQMAVNTRLGKADPDLTEQEKEMLQHSNRLIECIKQVRARTGIGLKEAKDLVDKYREQAKQERIAREFGNPTPQGLVDLGDHNA